MNSIFVPKLDLKGKTFDVIVPSSKSLANRALVLSALSEGNFQLKGDFEAEDIQILIEALKEIGVHIETIGSEETIENNGIHQEGQTKGIVIRNDLSWMVDGRELELFLGNSGTSFRFLTSLVLFRKGSTILTGTDRMKERPIGDLVDALRQLGAEIEYLGQEGFPPLRVYGLKERVGGMVKIRGDVSSQFLSSILLVASAFEGSVEIVLDGKLVSGPYVEMTTDLMRKWDLAVQSSSEGFRVFPQRLSGFDFEIEADASAAVYWWAMEFLHECVINVLNVQNVSKQGDMQFKKVLHMLKTCNSPFEIDMNDMPDAALALMAVAPFHHSEVVIKNVGNLRVKESDRIDAISKELTKCGVRVEAGTDCVKISPFDVSVSSTVSDAIKIETYHDHRIAMCMAVFATKLGKVEILNPDCVSKSYPRFWDHLEMMY